MNTWLISGVILVIGFLISLFLILLNKYRAYRSRHNIDEYEGKRTTLTVRKKVVEKKEVEYSSGGLFNLQSIIMGLVTIGVTIAIGVSILSQLSTTLQDTTEAQNASMQVAKALSSASSIIPVIIAVTLVGIVISLVVRMGIGEKDKL